MRLGCGHRTRDKKDQCSSPTIANDNGQYRFAREPIPETSQSRWRIGLDLKLCQRAATWRRNKAVIYNATGTLKHGRSTLGLLPDLLCQHMSTIDSKTRLDNVRTAKSNGDDLANRQGRR